MSIAKTIGVCLLNQNPSCFMIDLLFTQVERGQLWQSQGLARYVENASGDHVGKKSN